MGIFPLQRALQVAYERGLDLVQVTSTTSPPVCRLLDYGKYKYEQTKKERKAKKGQQKAGALKELRLRPKIEEHDLQAKVRTAKKLLQEGNKVRLVLRFRGREAAYPELGEKVVQKVVEACKELAAVTSSANDEKSITVVLSPVAGRKPQEAKGNAQTKNS